MEKSEIRLVEIPTAGGHEQSGMRPAIVLSEVEARIVIIIPFTSNPQAYTPCPPSLFNVAVKRNS